jgi:two-component system, LytTR family, response regulator
LNCEDQSIRVVIADDEPLARQLLARLVEAQGDLTIVGQAGDGESARRLIKDARPDLVFLDIMMPTLNGLEMVASLQSGAHQPHIVFVTAFEDHAIRAFELDALDYLVKPIERARFARTVQRAKTAILAMREQGTADDIAASAAQGPEPYVIVRHRDELIRIPEHDIFWLEAASQYVHIHTESARFIVAESLSSYLDRLASNCFVRVHRSAAVNRSKVAHVVRKQNGVHELQLANGVGVPLSRSRRNLLAEILGACAANARSATA